MLGGYAFPSDLAWNASQCRIYSSWRSKPRCGLLRERGVEINNCVAAQSATRLAITAFVDFSESCGLERRPIPIAQTIDQGTHPKGVL
jgi:hypothetical protein